MPREIAAEIAVLKGIVAAFVMSTNARKPIYAAAARRAAELADVLLWSRPRNLDAGLRARDWDDAQPTTPSASASCVDQVASPHRPVRDRPGTSGSSAEVDARVARPLGRRGTPRLRSDRVPGRISSKRHRRGARPARTSPTSSASDVTLKTAGVGSMKGLCPFHDERSPSFHVRPQVGFYHCFGCGEGGDVYTFLQQDGPRHLPPRRWSGSPAASAIELHYEDGGGPAPTTATARASSRRTRRREEFFRDAARRPRGRARARASSASAASTPAAAAHFGVGYAPKGWDALTQRTSTAQGFTQRGARARPASCRRGDRGVYDRFRGRLIWPIRDVTGQTVGFGARQLLDDDKGPKYLNTPETPVYHKSQVLYGLDLAKRDIARGKPVVVVEGYTDVMACHLAGVTDRGRHLRHRVRRRPHQGGAPGARRRRNANVGGTGEVIFTFDPDAAGQKAAMPRVRRGAALRRADLRGGRARRPRPVRPAPRAGRRRRCAGSSPPRRRCSSSWCAAVLDAHDLETVEGRRRRAAGRRPGRGGHPRPGALRRLRRNLADWLGMDLNEVGRAVTAAKGCRPAVRMRAVEEPLERGPARAQRISLIDLPTDPFTRSERDLHHRRAAIPGRGRR